MIAKPSKSKARKRPRDFRSRVHGILMSIEEMLVSKNQAYGDSALNPVRVFSKASAEEQILVRLDDKLSRIARGKSAGEDAFEDLQGYLVLLKMAKNGKRKPAKSVKNKRTKQRRTK